MHILLNSLASHLTGAGNQPPAEKPPRGRKNPIQGERRNFLALPLSDCQRAACSGDPGDARKHCIRLVWLTVRTGAGLSLLSAWSRIMLAPGVLLLAAHRALPLHATRLGRHQDVRVVGGDRVWCLVTWKQIAA